MPTTLAVFSDVHANLPALEAVLADLDIRLGRGEVDAVYCLGDLVGYATWPNEVVAAVRQRGIPTIAGNYDEGVGLASDDCGCAYPTDEERARGDESIAYTNGVVTEATRRYLRGLPRHLRLTLAAPRRPDAAPVEVLMVHGSPRRTNEYLFEDRPDRSVVRMMGAAGADVMLFGHTHKPYHKVLEVEADGETVYRHAVNTGSVGKPKDGDPRAGYVLLTLDPERPTSDPGYCAVEFVRVAYDVERAAQAVEASPLPDAFARMLRDA
ncbi:metallophosphoesterase family protein [Rubrivirga marina]|uniref:YfcE family phosphodiesterase n=1 Tax=Rubrivirga marina TaxID=1196024 RepID=A0A271IZG0_9BACT|nr:metallophosphoesterase family protein [Rubrivirga marina]PAP75879.1 YfcE family phosphodiesterase [Rubrivirga marina]